MATSNNTIFSDIDPFFDANPVSKDVNRITNEAAIRQSILNLILTEKDERVFQPNLFCGIKEDLFDLITPISAENIREKIVNVLRRYEPRIEELTVNVRANPDQNGYDVKISYLPRKSLNLKTIEFFLERVS